MKTHDFVAVFQLHRSTEIEHPLICNALFLHRIAIGGDITD